MDSSKRCLFIMPLLFCGGSEKQIRFLVDGLSKRGYPVSVYVESSVKELAKDEQDFVQTHSNVSFVFGNSSVAATKDKNLIVKYAAKITSILKMMMLLRKEIKKNKVKQVMVTNLTGLMLLFFFKFYHCEVIYNERNPGDAVTSFMWRRFLLKRCNQLVCNSKAASQIMSQRLKRPVPVINNGVKLQDFSPCQQNEGPYQILVPARISKIKNQKVIIEAIAELKDEFNFQVIFAGTVEDNQYYEELLKRCDQLDIKKYVKLIGFTSNIKHYYLNSQLLILASYEEGTPNVLLESYMYGVPVLASNIPMNADCILRKDLLFSTDDSKELASKIKQSMKRSSEETLNILKENRDFVVNNYGEDRMVSDYVKILFN